MDTIKVGALLLQLRKEKGMTQKQIANLMNLSDKAISKWERGLGCPDVSLLRELSNLYGVNIEQILEGELEGNHMDSGNLKRVKFYVCPNCANMINNTGNATITCCGRKLSPQVAKPVDQEHIPVIEETEDEYVISFHHEMTKAHYISFLAYVTSDRILMIKLYPEQEPQVRVNKLHGGRIGHRHSGKLYYFCNQHGLWVV